MDKQVVEFAGHPRLGAEPHVRTSVVQRIERDDKDAICEIETLNTIYRRRFTATHPNQSATETPEQVADYIAGRK